MTYHMVIDLACGCTRSSRHVRREQIPNVGDVAECLTHGFVGVIHVAYVSA